MILLDTGYLIALADVRDALHARAAAWAQVIHEPVLITEYVVWECVNYFSLAPRRGHAHALVAHLRSERDCEWVSASPALFDAGLELHSHRPDKDWSLTDCISFALMYSRGINRALAHDHHFAEAGFITLLRDDPPEYRGASRDDADVDKR
jgi:predicted nucleic acid-binding protein